MDLKALGFQQRKLNQFAKKEIYTVEDLAKYFPRKYHDFRFPKKIDHLIHGEFVSVVGKIKEIKTHPKFVQAKVSDGSSSRYLYVTWFHQPYVAKMLVEGIDMMFCGKITIDETYGTRKMNTPLFFSKDLQKYAKIMPIYSKIAGMSDEYLQRAIDKALASSYMDETLESSVLRKFKLMKRPQAYRTIHQPKNEEELKKAQERFVFDDLFEFAMQMERMRQEQSLDSPFVMHTCKSIFAFLEKLPFSLTDGQNQVLRHSFLKMREGKRLNALVQGDVGCGKTIVAIILMMIAKENGYQSALMAPTNVLAKQHYEELLERAEGSGTRIAFLSGETKAREKKKILQGLKSGEIHMVVGTHALLSKDVEFRNLALTVVDEEHRFGVKQRNALREKAKKGVHHVSMSATPIPRSLALALYGEEIDVLTIKTRPKGRQPVLTLIRNNEEKIYEGIYKEIKRGRQAYIVCPLIEDSDADTLQDVDSVESTYKKVTKYFKKYPEVRISMITGKMKPEEIEEEIGKFSRHETDILISTTIIEVGVNVQNASTIIIKNAERFGLAQLHQLRGRVGRGVYKSYCVLLSEHKDNQKLQAMCETTDGFKIAEKDLEIRGTGDFIGTKQTGQNKYVMLMLSNRSLYEEILKEVREIFKDPVRIHHYDYLYNLDVDIDVPELV